MELAREEMKRSANRNNRMAYIEGLPCAGNICFYTCWVNLMRTREVHHSSTSQKINFKVQ